jgi:O6-methylguanine-DNA--protein-cysteine methyltransferase
MSVRSKSAAVTIMKSPYFNHVEQLENSNETATTAPEVNIPYPITAKARNNFRTNTGKVGLLYRVKPDPQMTIIQRLTAHKWAVYDFVLKIPRGKVTTYKDISLAVGGSPRSGMYNN